MNTPFSHNSNHLLRTAFAALCVFACVAFAPGCASFTEATSGMFTGDITPVKKQRAESVNKNISDKRDEAEYRAALESWERNDSKKSREQLGSLLARNPRHRDSRLLMAEVCLADDQPEQALKNVNAVLDYAPDHAQALYMKGFVFESVGQTEGAVDFYAKAAKADPQNALYKESLAKAKNAGKARVAQSVNSEDAVVQTAYAEMLDESSSQEGPMLTAPRNMTPTKARRAAAEDSPSRPDSLETPHRKITVREGYSDSADKIDQPNNIESTAISDDAKRFLSLGSRSLAENNLEAANEFFQKAIAAQPDNPQVPLSASATSLRSNRPDLAIALLTPASKRFATSAPIFRMLGAAHYRAGDYQSSQVALRQALSLDKSHALSYFLMGSALAKLGKSGQADVYYRQAAAMDSRYEFRR